ncbi:MAG: zinc metalloprotease HtpX [Phycisphaerales bacterium]|nr:zinc metalloprotease HtpX [Phycisphaerales bacterium]
MRFWNNTKTALLLGAMMGLCMFVGHLIGGLQGMMMGLLFGGIGNIISFWFSDKIALSMMQGQEITRDDVPWLYDMIQDLSQRAGLPMPRVYVCPHEAPNAFATGRNPANSAVAITAGMLRGFSQPEIEGVLAHEIGHIKHRDVLISTIAAVMAGLISYAGYALMFFGGGSRDNQNPLGAIGAIVAMVLAPIGAAIIQMAISRQREYAADSFAGELVGDPRKLAYALQRLQRGNERTPTDVNPSMNSLFIIEPLSGQHSFTSIFATHPPTEKRIAALMEQARVMGLA